MGCVQVERPHPGGPEPARDHADDVGQQRVIQLRVASARLTDRSRVELTGVYRAATTAFPSLPPGLEAEAGSYQTDAAAVAAM
jgi:hypothetical protein